MRIVLSVLFLFVSALHALGQAPAPIADSCACPIRFTLLPQNHIIPILTSNATAHRVSVSNVTQNNNYIVSMGGVFPVASMSRKKNTLQFSAAASVYSQLIRPKGHLLVFTIDYFADFYFDLTVHKNFAIRFGSGHTSHHFSDDAVVIYGYTNPINYVRDYYQLFAFYKLPKNKGNVYGGAYYNYHFLVPYDVSNTFIYELGTEYAPVEITRNLAPYVGISVKFRGELNYKTSENYQVGIKYTNPSGSVLRAAINQRRGMEERGQFFEQTNSFNSLSMYFDF